MMPPIAPHAEVKQRITLLVDPLRLGLRIPRPQEHIFREAGDELARTLRIYRQKYPNTSEVPAEGYLAMAAIDLAVRFQQTHLELTERQANLAPRLRALNDSLDALIASSRSLIDG